MRICFKITYVVKAILEAEFIRKNNVDSIHFSLYLFA